MAATAPRVEVELKATGICYLSNKPPFYPVIHSALYNTEERVTFLQDGYAGVKGYQPINSNEVIQCFDNETGEQVSYIQFTTSNTRKPYELPFITSSLRPGRKYRLRSKPATSISHGPTSAENASNSLVEAPSSLVSKLDLPTISTQTILWKAADGNETIVFGTRSSRPSTPNVTVSLSAPSTYSLSKKFTFTLTLSTDAAYPITVLANRALVKSDCSDVEILDATSRLQLAPNLIVCRDEDEHRRDQFLRLERTYTEHRKLDFKDPLWEELELEVGKEYILSHLGEKCWWTDSIDEIMTHLESKSNIVQAFSESIEFASAGGVRFKVVE